MRSGSDIIGSLFEPHPKILNLYDVRGEAVIFEFSISAILKILDEEKEFRPFSKYPSVIRDIAVLVPKDVRVGQVLDIIENEGGELLADSDLFDYYEGAEIQEGKKNLAFHLIFQSLSRTLSESEIDSIMEDIMSALESKTDWEVRK